MELKKVLFVFVLVIFMIGVASAVNFNDNVAYYKLDNSADEVLDATGNLNNGTNQGAGRGLSGKINNSFNFTGSEYVDINVIQDNLAANTSGAINLWINASNDDGAEHVIFSMSRDANSTKTEITLVLDQRTGRDLVYAYLWNDGTQDWILQSPFESADSCVNNWCHIVLTHDGVKPYLWLNNTLATNYSTTTDLTSWFKTILTDAGSKADTTNLGILERNGGNYAGYEGKIDEVGIWDRNLSSGDVSDLWNSGSGRAYSITPAQITLTSPTNASTISDLGTNFTATYTAVGYNWTNATYYVWYDNGSVFNNSVVVDITGLTNSTDEYIDNFAVGDYVWSVYGCYSNGVTDNCTWADNYTLSVIGFSVLSETYNTNTLSGSTETFSVNLSILSGYRLSELNLIYNGTSYLTPFTEYATNTYFGTKTINVPDVSAESNATFYWQVTFESGDVQNTSSHIQTIKLINIDNCSSYTNLIFNFTMWDEDNLKRLTTSDNLSVKISLSFSPLDDSSDILNFSEFYNNTNDASICMQNLVTTASMRVDGVIEYKSNGRFTEFYHIQNYTLNNQTRANNVSLYNLNSTRGQEYKIIYKDSNFVAVVGAVIDLQRKYVDEGVFKTIERPKTGTEGYTIGHLISSDAIYNILVYKNGRLLGSFLEVVADCQNPSISTCTINLNDYESSNLPSDFTNYNDLSFTFDYDYDTRTVTSTYSIPSGITSTISLNVSLYDTLGNTSVCSDILTSSGGQLSCVVPTAFGNGTIIAQLFKDGDASGYTIISLRSKPSELYGNSIIFIALLVFLSMAGIGSMADNPMAFGFILILGSIMMVGINLIYVKSVIGVGATLLWFIMAIILVLIKGGTRQ